MPPLRRRTVHIINPESLLQPDEVFRNSVVTLSRDTSGREESEKKGGDVHDIECGDRSYKADSVYWLGEVYLHVAPPSKKGAWKTLLKSIDGGFLWFICSQIGYTSAFSMALFVLATFTEAAFIVGWMFQNGLHSAMWYLWEINGIMIVFVVHSFATPLARSCVRTLSRRGCAWQWSSRSWTPRRTSGRTTFSSEPPPKMGMRSSASSRGALKSGPTST